MRGRDLRTFDLSGFYRFFSAVCIALAHYTVYFPVSANFRHYIFEKGNPLMGFFFTLSGFVIMHVYDGRINSFAKYVDYLRRRLARIYPLFLATFLVSYLYALYVNNHSEMVASSAILPNLLLVHAWNTTHILTFDYPSWSVSAEMFVYLLFPAFLFMLNRMGPFAPASALHPRVGGHRRFFRIRARKLAGRHLSTADACAPAPSFVAGMVVHRLATRDFASFRAPAWFAHAMVIATIPLVLAGTPGVVVLVYMAALVFVMVAAEPEPPNVLSRPFARTLANASYGFYLWHVPVADVILRSGVHRLRLPPTATYALAPVAIVATAALSIVSFKYFEDPLRRYLGSSVRKSPNLISNYNNIKHTARDAQ